MTNTFHYSEMITQLRKGSSSVRIPRYSTLLVVPSRIPTTWVVRRKLRLDPLRLTSLLTFRIKLGFVMVSTGYGRLTTLPKVMLFWTSSRRTSASGEVLLVRFLPSCIIELYQLCCYECVWVPSFFGLVVRAAASEWAPGLRCMKLE